MNSVIQDVRYGLRLLRQSPGFAALAILTFALGMAGFPAVTGPARRR